GVGPPAVPAHTSIAFGAPGALLVGSLGVCGLGIAFEEAEVGAGHQVLADKCRPPVAMHPALNHQLAHWPGSRAGWLATAMPYASFKYGFTMSSNISRLGLTMLIQCIAA